MAGGTLRSSRGLTLIEVIFVLAIFAVLVAIIVPLATSLLSDSNAVKAQADEDAIATALTKFFADNGVWPASDGSSSNNQSVPVLLVGDGGPTTGSSGGLTSNIPADDTSGSSWSLPSNTTGSNGKFNALNHLLVNNPDGDGNEAEATEYKTTGSKRWRGPYITSPSADPFGNDYVINIGGVVSGGTAGKGWILSAGKNGKLETAKTASTLSGDDIGFIYCTNCQ